MPHWVTRTRPRFQHLVQFTGQVQAFTMQPEFRLRPALKGLKPTSKMDRSICEQGLIYIAYMWMWPEPTMLKRHIWPWADCNRHFMNCNWFHWKGAHPWAWRGKGNRLNCHWKLIKSIKFLCRVLKCDIVFALQ